MKISNSKKMLAKIVAENGGWATDLCFAVQDACGNVNAYECKPVFSAGNSGFGHGGGRFNAMFKAKKITNWHQTILSREEYFHLYPVPDADGWIEWRGGECPVEQGALVDIKDADGEEWLAVKAAPQDEYSDASSVFWEWNCTECNRIVAYRLHKTQAGATDKLSSEAVSAAKIALMSDSIEGLVRKQTIEQLAADYRNAKDYAERKQKDADDANADADSKLKALELAGEALGLLVTPITSKQEPELVITDWRDLQVGDEVEYVDGFIGRRIGLVGVVDRFSPDATDGMQVGIVLNVSGDLAWPTKWRFIRRP